MSVFGGASLPGVVGKVRALLFQLRYVSVCVYVCVFGGCGGWLGGGGGRQSDHRERAAAGAVAEAPATDPGSRQ